MPESQIDKVKTILQKLCVEIPSRRVGSAGNRLATEFFARSVAAYGFKTKITEFDCLDWHHEGAQLTSENTSFEVFPSPYSLGCQVKAPLTIVTSLNELMTAELPGTIILLRGDIAKEQIMPKNFPFYNPDHHKEIINLLENKQPAAIVAATSRDVEMVGSQYPFPLFEDGDFNIPSVYMTEEEGLRLAEFAGLNVSLVSHAKRIPAKGYNVIACKGKDSNHRIVLFAHIDSRLGTPGANDNASGVAVLVLLAELLAEYSGHLGIELVAMNGEDYFSSPGEQQYLSLNEGRFDTILLGINLDDVAYNKGNIAYSLYDCPREIAAIIRSTFTHYPGLLEGQAWYQGDHGLFILNHRPALAITSELLTELMANITHTSHDTPEVVAPAKIVFLAEALKDLVVNLDLQLV